MCNVKAAAGSMVPVDAGHGKCDSPASLACTCMFASDRPALRKRSTAGPTTEHSFVRDHLT